ncbi:MAG: OFA family MFS transporter [Rectinema subterraneum]|uniref:OFA family MFS transporter n=1 Tax=Rectinema subterraneum TaxID=2653714 RepID=UPI003C7D7B69
MNSPNGARRWFYVASSTILMICFGTVYSWSYFQTPIMQAYGWNNAQVSLTFSFAIFFIGIAAAVGGILLSKTSPMRMALLGSILFSIGYFIAGYAFSIRSLALLYIGYGVVGGTGLGLGYVTPVTTIAKWFPDKKGLATGIVIMGFGLGALLMSKVIAPLFISWHGGNLVAVFLSFAIFFAIFTIPASLTLRNPAQGWSPGNEISNRSSPPANGPEASRSRMPAFSLRQASSDIFSIKFLLIWLVFFCNITSGISIIGFQSPMFQDLMHKIDSSLSPQALASMGATLIATTSLFNGFGRLLWGAVSDSAGRIRTYRLMLGSELIIFIALIVIKNPWLFAIFFCWILLCYGGGFGIMPATISELFGPEKMTIIYGVVLTAWSLGGVVGPQITAFIKDKMPSQASMLSFIVGTAFIAMGFCFSLLIPAPGHPKHSASQPR